MPMHTAGKSRPADESTRFWQVWGDESLAFMERLLQSSGLGDETYLPESKLL